MGKRGPKPKRQKVEWSAEIAYAVGLLVTDGSLSKDGRHIDLTSKDIEQLENFKKCVGINSSISYKKPSRFSHEKCPRVQFSDVTLYTFLVDEVGLTPAKTKTLGELNIPKKYFFDFLRGHHDGDGCFYSFWDKRWKNSFMFYLCFIAYRKEHLQWIRGVLNDSLDVKGHMNTSGRNSSTYQLKYAKKESLKILKKMYTSKNIVCLSRKRLKIEHVLGIVDESL